MFEIMNCLIVILSLFLISFPLLNANQLNFDRRIYLGRVVKSSDDYPFVTHMRSRSRPNVPYDETFAHSTGVLISKNKVTATAHSMKSDSPMVESYIPTYKPDDVYYLRVIGEKFYISMVWIHPNYTSPSSAKYDIAILQLDREITETAAVKVVSIDFDNIVKEGEELIMIGFGDDPTLVKEVFDRDWKYLRQGEFKAQNCTVSYSLPTEDEPICFKIMYGRDHIYPTDHDNGDASAPVVRKKDKKLVGINTFNKFKNPENHEYEVVIAAFAAESNKKFIKDVLKMTYQLGYCVK